MHILSLGEALIDFKQTGHLAFQGFEGGSPMNVAVAAARLDSQVGFGGQISSDLFGKALRAYLLKNKVDTSYLLEHDAPSTFAFVAEIDGDAHFSFVNNQAADTLYNPQPRPELPASLRFLQFGSISLLSEPTASSITDIVALHQSRCITVFDPNVRPNLTADKEAYKAKLQGWLELSHIVKVSTQDLTWLYPGQESSEIASAWLAHGMQALMITNGGEGVTLYRPGKAALFVASPRVSVADTVGAGDTITGSLMAELDHRGFHHDLSQLSDNDWQEVLRFCTVAAAINCTRSGAQPPTRQEIADFS